MKKHYIQPQTQSHSIDLIGAICVVSIKGGTVDYGGEADPGEKPL